MRSTQLLSLCLCIPLFTIGCSDGSDRVNSCEGLSTKSGSYPGLKIFSGGMERSYLLYVPAIDTPPRPLPLVFNFHGRGGTGEAQEFLSEFAALADVHKFIVVSPDGIGNTWNAGDCCGIAVEAAIDDVGFTEDLIEKVSSEYCVDLNRVYSTGLSNGGYMSYRLACEMADRFAAIAPVAARNRTLSCAPSRPVPMIAIHGTEDIIVDYSLAVASVDAWIAYNQCSVEPQVVYQQGDVECVSYDQCAQGATTEFCTVDGGGHNWPGSFDLFEADPETFYWAGKNTRDIDASAEIWRFFVKHPRR